MAATGNQGGALLYPAAYDDSFAVAATTDRQTRPSYSNYGAETDIAAPGGTESTGIYSLAPGGSYATLYGTSMATPHVSGLAALIWSLSPNLSPAEVAQLIEETARQVGADPYNTAGWNQQLGHGEINAAAALQRIAGGAGPTVTPTRTRVPVATATPTKTPTPYTESVEINLEPGWNLVSFNMQPADERIEVLIRDIRSSLELILNYRCSGGGLSYYPDLPQGMSTLQTMQAGRGYWVKMTEAAVWRITGRPLVGEAPLALCHGWNLAGYLADAQPHGAVCPFLSGYCAGGGAGIRGFNWRFILCGASLAHQQLADDEARRRLLDLRQSAGDSEVPRRVVAGGRTSDKPR